MKRLFIFDGSHYIKIIAGQLEGLPAFLQERP